MIGGLYLLFNTIGLTIGYIRNNMSNTYSKSYANKLYNEGKNRTHTYIDTEGNDRDLKTNHKVFIYRDKNRDLIVKDLKTGIETNIDKPIREERYREERKEAIQKAKKNNGIAEFGKFSERRYSKSNLYFKERYIDTKGNLYIKKYMIWNTKTMELNESDRIGCFYVNIKTFKIDYTNIIKAGEIFKHCFKCDPPYESYDILYANKEECKKYMKWYNENIYKIEKEPLEFWGEFYISDYKKY